MKLDKYEKEEQRSHNLLIKRLINLINKNLKVISSINIKKTIQNFFIFSFLIYLLLIFFIQVVEKFSNFDS